MRWSQTSAYRAYYPDLLSVFFFISLLHSLVNIGFLQLKLGSLNCKLSIYTLLAFFILFFFFFHFWCVFASQFFSFLSDTFCSFFRTFACSHPPTFCCFSSFYMPPELKHQGRTDKSGEREEERERECGWSERGRGVDGERKYAVRYPQRVEHGHLSWGWKLKKRLVNLYSWSPRDTGKKHSPANHLQEKADSTRTRMYTCIHDWPLQRVSECRIDSGETVSQEERGGDHFYTTSPSPTLALFPQRKALLSPRSFPFLLHPPILVIPTPCQSN